MDDRRHGEWRSKDGPERARNCSFAVCADPARGRLPRRLLGFLQRGEMTFQSRAVLALGFEVGLEFLDQQFEAPDFVAKLLEFTVRRGRLRDAYGSRPG